MPNGFIKNEDLLQEDCRVEDLLDFSEQIQEFEKKIKKVKKPSILTLVGKFGIGKSTMLYQLEQKKEEDALWVNFDAWKYPDRRDLWEGLVLDFADQLGGKTKKKTKKKIEGKSAGSKLDILTDIVGSLKDIPGINVLDKIFKEVFEISPAKRVFEIQRIFTELINKAEAKKLFIVVEDIDRSGDAGTFFLETLKQFLTNLETEKELLVIVPMGDDNYHAHIDSYLKCVDYVEFFSPKSVNLEKFVDAIFDEKLFEGESRADSRLHWTGAKRRTQVISFLEALLRNEDKMTMRLLKNILRKANVAYINQSEDGCEPDFRVTICIEAAKYFSLSANTRKSYFEEFKEIKSMKRSSIYGAFVQAMLTNAQDILEPHRNDPKDKSLAQATYDIKFTERKGGNGIREYPSHPWQYGRFNGEYGYGVCDFYLKY